MIRWGAIGVLILGGCASPTGYGSAVSPPAPYLMQSPCYFPKMKPGDDARNTLVKAARAHNCNTAKVRGLQSYVLTVRGIK